MKVKSFFFFRWDTKPLRKQNPPILKIEQGYQQSLVHLLQRAPPSCFHPKLGIQFTISSTLSYSFPSSWSSSIFTTFLNYELHYQNHPMNAPESTSTSKTYPVSTTPILFVTAINSVNGPICAWLSQTPALGQTSPTSITVGTTPTNSH